MSLTIEELKTMKEKVDEANIKSLLPYWGTKIIRDNRLYKNEWSIIVSPELYNLLRKNIEMRKEKP